MTKYLFAAVCILFLISHSCKESRSNIVFHKSHEPSRAKVPFSDAVEVGNLFFLTGQIGKDHKAGKLVEGGIEAETKQIILNIEDVLEHHNLTLENVIKCTVILKNIEDFSKFNAVYRQFFTKKPARTTFAASGLAGGASIEIDVIASK